MTSLGGSGIVNGAVRAIVTTYNDRGLAAYLTSYDSATARASGNVVNEIAYAHDAWGNVRQSDQSHHGLVFGVSVRRDTGALVSGVRLG